MMNDVKERKFPRYKNNTLAHIIKFTWKHTHKFNAKHK